MLFGLLVSCSICSCEKLNIGDCRIYVFVSFQVRIGLRHVPTHFCVQPVPFCVCNELSLGVVCMFYPLLATIYYSDVEEFLIVMGLNVVSAFLYELTAGQHTGAVVTQEFSFCVCVAFLCVLQFLPPVQRLVDQVLYNWIHYVFECVNDCLLLALLLTGNLSHSRDWFRLSGSSKP